MKRGTPEHPKVARLADALGVPIYSAIGILESLWHLTAKYHRRGDIGRWSDSDIAAGLRWEKDPVNLVEQLVETGWLDRDPEHRLLVHDWSDHADNSCRQSLADAGLCFCGGEPPRRSARGRPKLQGKTSPGNLTPRKDQMRPQPEPEPEPKPSEPSSADLQLTYGTFSEFWSRIPANRQRAKIRTHRAFATALLERPPTEGCTLPRDFARWLTEQVAAYYRSEEGRGRYAKWPAGWLEEGRFDDPPEAWREEGGEGRARKQGDVMWTRSEEAAAARRAEDEKVQQELRKLPLPEEVGS